MGEAIEQRRRDVLLIVDDEEALLQALVDLFRIRAPEIDLKTARTGEEGLVRLREGPVDAILSDYRMPGMTGLDFLDEARRLAPQVPRVLMTAYADLSIALRAIQDTKVATMVTKPMDPERLIAEIRQILQARAAERARQVAFGRMVDHLARPRRDPAASGAATGEGNGNDAPPGGSP